MVPSIIDVWGYDREFCSLSTTHRYNVSSDNCLLEGGTKIYLTGRILEITPTNHQTVWNRKKGGLTIEYDTEEQREEGYSCVQRWKCG